MIPADQDTSAGHQRGGLTGILLLQAGLLSTASEGWPTRQRLHFEI